ncbi:MAG: hypothetical protein M1838_000740 [Thelocarpon superellum]|nr:MAG: hypothetical protein M1838_000740 [Thelocarpon superellum]
MAPATAHHHRNTTRVAHKPFKSRHLTKNTLKELSKGKVETGAKGQRRTPHQQVMSKLDRRNQNRQRQQLKHQEKNRATSVFAGREGAPRVVAVISLCKDVEVPRAVERLNESLDITGGTSSSRIQRVMVDRFKQRIQYVHPDRDLVQMLDACRVADFVMFVLSAEHEVDQVGELVLRAVEGQGVSNVDFVIQGLDQIQPPKRRPPIVSSLKSFVHHFFPAQEKLYSLDARQECSNLMRSICTATPRGIRWREERSWMLVEDLCWPEATRADELVVTGVVRGKGLQPDRLVHLGDWGDYQIDRITAAPVKIPPSGTEKMGLDVAAADETLAQPTDDQDGLDELASEEIIMADAEEMAASEAVSDRKGVLLDDHHYFSDDNTHIPPPPKRLPKGTSSYQAAWLLDDVSDSGSDEEEKLDNDGDVSMFPPSLPQDGVEGLDRQTRPEPTETAPSEPSEMFLDPAPEDEAEALAAFRSRTEKEAEDDREFPDEIELHPHVLARERLARYRGLKSLRTSKWETDEDRAHEPPEWRRLLHVVDYKGSRSQASREALVGGVQPGVRVHVHLRHVPRALRDSKSPMPLTLFSLLRHEHKQTVVHMSVTLNAEYPQPVKSKEELILQCGPRRLVIHPLFSQPGHTRNNVHKFARYLHPGHTAVATFLAPLTWGSAPALIFRRASRDERSDRSPESPGLELIGRGTNLPSDNSRVLAKRVILTGHPYKIHKKLVTVRYMFFDADDVNWFKALQLWTKRGRSGFIKESLGTHGYFKATFDAKINPQDAVGVSLYKRVFPRLARPWREGD